VWPAESCLLACSSTLYTLLQCTFQNVVWSVVWVIWQTHSWVRLGSFLNYWDILARPKITQIRILSRIFLKYCNCENPVFIFETWNVCFRVYYQKI
jgi:hypothetical protein